MSDCSPLERAKKASGGATGIAKAIGGITVQAVSQWKKVPAERVLDVERISGVPRHELRPDIYPAEPANGATTPNVPGPQHTPPFTAAAE